MLKKTFRRFGALLMVMALAVSVFAVNAFADGNTDDSSEVGQEATTTAGVSNGDSLTIKKTVTADGDTYSPATSFTFTITPSQDTASYDDNVVYAGVAGGAYFAEGKDTIPYKATDGIINASTGMTHTTTISTDVKKFDAPGIYHYTVTETAGSYEGITYDTAARDLYVYVTNKVGGGLEVSNVVLAKTVTITKDGEQAEEIVKTDEWVNDYGKTKDTTHDVKITKVVEGSQGDHNKNFTFTVSVTGAKGERYKVAYKNASSDTEETITYVDSSNSDATDAVKSLSIDLKDTGYIHIYGLTDSDTYTVTEGDYSSDGYTTTVDGVEDISLTATGKATVDKSTRTVTNKKEVVATGVITTIAPYALMLVVAGAFAVVFLTRRNRAE